MKLLSTLAFALPLTGISAHSAANAFADNLARRANGPARPHSSPDDCRCRGDKLLEMIAGQKGIRPEFVNYGDIKAGGIETYPDTNQQATEQLKPALKAIGIPETGWVQWGTMRMDGGADVTPTTFKWPPPKGRIYRISDILYLGYKQMAEEAKAEYKDLETLFVANCYNADTEGLVDHYFNKMGKAITDYPGQVFRMNIDKDPGKLTDDERWEMDVARAFFGSPNGLTLGWILINRVEDFKGRTVKDVRVWGDDPKHPQLQFTLEDLPKK